MIRRRQALLTGVRRDVPDSIRAVRMIEAVRNVKKGMPRIRASLL